MVWGAANLPKATGLGKGTGVTTTKKKNPGKVTATGPQNPRDEAMAIQRTATAKLPAAAAAIVPNPNPSPSGASLGMPMGTSFSAQSTVPTGRTPVDQPGSNNTSPVNNQMSGFASRFDQSQLNPLYEDASLMLPDVLEYLGMPTGGARQASLQNWSQRMGMLSSLLSLTQQGEQVGSDERWLNTFAELMDNTTGRGGVGIDYQNAMQMLLSEDPGAALSGVLYGDPDAPYTLEQQNEMLNPLFGAATVSANPFYQRAMASAYQGAENAAKRSLATGGADPRIADYLREKLAGIVPGL